MSYKISENFSLTKTERIPSRKTKVYFYSHKKTGAQIIYMKNANENASFGTFFKTPAHNNKGTTHILEHLVFSGSKNFPKGDILDYIKNNSLVSFVNAATYIDTTLYYFASSFEKDFLNVLNMYLDFIYFPILDEEMFKREAFFYTKNKNEYNFNGIVFNEMKNNLLTLNSKIYDTLREMFETGPYSYESGGDPLDIVDLTNDEIKKYHKKYYHPSNSYTVIFGKINEKKVFEKLNEVYSQFEKSENFDLKPAVPTFKNKKIEVEYQSPDVNDRGNFSKYYLFKDITSEEDFVLLKSGISTLLNFDFSPVAKDLQDSKLLNSFSLILSDDLKYPVLIISCKGVMKENIEKLENLLDASIKKHTTNISNEIKEILLKKLELYYKELEFSKNQGVYETSQILEKWKNDFDPLILRRGLKTLSLYKKSLKEKNLEKFIMKAFSDAQTLSARFNPSKNLLDEYNQKISDKLQQKLKNLDSDKLNQEILNFEKKGDNINDSNVYPNIKKLSIKDLKVDVLEFPIKVKDSMYYTEVTSEDIFRLKLGFDISKIDSSKYFYLETYLDLLTKTGIKKHNYMEFGKLTSKIIPNFHVYSEFFKDCKTDKYNFYAIFNLTFLLTDKDKVLDLILELKNDIYFEKDWVLFCLREKLEEIEQTMVQKPERFGLLLAKSLVSPSNYYSYQTESLPYYEKLKNIITDFENNYENFFEELKKIHELILSQNCFLYYATSKNYLEDGRVFLKNFVDKLNLKVVTKEKIQSFTYPDYEKAYKNSPDETYNHFISNSENNFVIVSFKYDKVSKDYKDLLPTTELYIDKYLWDNVRIKGKAYSYLMNYNISSNSSYFQSIRDPNIDKTIDCFSNYQKSYNINKLKKKDYEKLKLQKLSEYKLILTNNKLFSITIYNFLSNHDFEYRKSILERLKSMKFIEYKDLFHHLKKVVKKFVVVVATEKNLSKSKHKFITTKFK